MTKKLLLFACSIMSTMLNAQSVPMAFEDWKTTAGTQNFFYKNITKTDGLGNIYVAGATMNNGMPDMLIAKYNPKGYLLWMKQFAGASLNGADFVTDIAVTSTDVYLTGAITNNTVSPETDCVTMRLAASTGSVVWSSTYTGAAGSIDAGNAININAAGNIFITGLTYNTSGNSDVLVIKYNGTSGAQAWASTYNYTSGLDDIGLKVGFRLSSVYISAALTSATNTYKAAVLNFAEATGGLASTSIGAGVTTTSVDAVADMVTDAAGNTIIAGSSYVTGQGTNFYVQKLAPTTLATVWTYTWNGSASGNDFVKGIALDASDNVYISGYSDGYSTLGRELTVMKLSSSGINQWTQTSGLAGNDEAADIVLDGSNNIYVAGYKTTSNNQNYYTAKYSNGGTKMWEIETGGNMNDYVTNLALDSLNNVVVTGQSETAPGTYEFLTAKYVQKDVITPTDFNGEAPSEAFWYYKNKGQLRDINDSIVTGVAYYMDKTSPNIYINKNSMSFVFAKVDTIAATNDTIQKVNMTFKGVSATSKTYPTETQPFYMSYFNGTNRDFAEIHGNKKLITSEIYPGIDLMYSSNQKGIKYYYIIKPGGNPSDIQIEFDGANSYSLNPITNDLSINTLAGSITFDRPTAYQLTAGNTTVAVTGWTPDWQINSASNKYKFGTGAYTSSLTLVIQVDRGNTSFSPVSSGNLIWNTFQGGNMDDWNVDLKLDRYGNIYTLAYTTSQNYYLPNTFIPLAPVLNKEASLMLKYNMYGKRINQVYIGSSSDTQGKAITLVNDSSLVLVGSSAGANISGPFGGSNPASAFTSTVGPSFIMKFNPALTTIIWSTRYPGSITDVDSKTNGDIYLCAHSHTSTAYVKSQANALNLGVPNITSANNTMVTKFNQTGVPLWSSFIGVKPWSSTDAHIKIDTTTNQFYVFGKPVDLTDFQAYNKYGTFLQSTLVNSSYFDTYIKKFNSTDSMVVSTLYGGNRDETLEDATILRNGDVCFVGTTYSTDTTLVVYNPHNGSYFSKASSYPNSKGWVTKFSPTFTKKWATLYGDSLRSTAFTSATSDNTNSNLMIGGNTKGMPNVGYSGCYSKASDPQGDGAFVSFTSGNTVTWATSMGANGIADQGILAVAFNPKNSNLNFAGGSSANSNFPWENYPNSYWQPLNQGPGHEECNVGRFDAVYITGINESATTEIKNSNVILYPNPAGGLVNLYFKQGVTATVDITICNALGQIIEKRNYKSIEDNTTLNFTLTHLAEGIYFVNISTETSTQALKFVTFK